MELYKLELRGLCKKTIIILFCFTLVFTLIGCGTKTTEDELSNIITSEHDEVNVSESVAGSIQEGICELYLEVLEDLWNVFPELNNEVLQIDIDLSELSNLTQEEKDYIMSKFASKHNLPYVVGTFEELCEQGFIDKENLVWKDGLFFPIKTDKETLTFDAQKWRSGSGAYFFGQCTAQKNADGKWSYTTGLEAVA